MHYHMYQSMLGQLHFTGTLGAGDGGMQGGKNRRGQPCVPPLSLWELKNLWHPGYFTGQNKLDNLAVLRPNLMP